jgi:hypothetical protein
VQRAQALLTARADHPIGPDSHTNSRWATRISVRFSRPGLV